MRKLVLGTTVGMALLSGCGEAPPVHQERANVVSTINAPPFPTAYLTDASRQRLSGGPGDSTEAEFFKIRYAAALSGKAGLVVVDGSSSEIRWFDANGALERVSGGRGAGPGEVGHVGDATLLPGDSVLILDWRNQRLAWFPPDGGTPRTRAISAPSLGSRVFATSSDGVLVATNAPMENFGGGEYNLTVDSIYGILVRDGLAPDTVVRLQGREAITWIDYADNGEPRGSRQMEVPFGRSTLMGAVGNRIVAVSTGDGVMHLHDMEGRLTLISSRSDSEGHVVTPKIRDQFVQAAAESAEANGARPELARRDAESRLQLLPEDRTLPVYDRLLIDRTGHRILLREFRLPWESDEPSVWMVFDTLGSVTSRWLTPASVELTQVADEFVVGVQKDEWGVESVTVMRVVPGRRE